jgi:hypothetical protein
MLRIWMTPGFPSPLFTKGEVIIMSDFEILSLVILIITLTLAAASYGRKDK